MTEILHTQPSDGHKAGMSIEWANHPTQKENISHKQPNNVVCIFCVDNPNTRPALQLNSSLRIRI